MITDPTPLDHARAPGRSRVAPGGRRRRLASRAGIAAGVLGAALGLAACSPTPANVGHGPLGVSQANRDAAAVIYIKDFSYVPKVVHIKAGQNVLVVNDGRDSHTVTANNGAFQTGPLAGGGDDGSFVISKPGVYHYFDALNPFMRGTIVVSG